jgi:hypothetical protein
MIMHAPLNLQILAIASGLTENEVVELWSQAREQSLIGADQSQHPRYDYQTRMRMTRLIESKATVDVPFNLVPWVLFNLHLGLLIVRASISLQRAGELARHLVSQGGGKHPA